MGVGSQGTLRVSGGRYTGFRGAVDSTRGELRVTGARFERNGSAVDIGDQTSLGLVSGEPFRGQLFGVSVTPGVPGLRVSRGARYTAVERLPLFEQNDVALSHCFEALCPDDASLSVANTVVSHSRLGTRPSRAFDQVRERHIHRQRGRWPDSHRLGGDVAREHDLGGRTRGARASGTSWTWVTTSSARTRHAPPRSRPWGPRRYHPSSSRPLAVPPWGSVTRPHAMASR